MRRRLFVSAGSGCLPKGNRSRSPPSAPCKTCTKPRFPRRRSRRGRLALRRGLSLLDPPALDISLREIPTISGIGDQTQRVLVAALGSREVVGAIGDGVELAVERHAAGVRNILTEHWPAACAFRPGPRRRR